MNLADLYMGSIPVICFTVKEPENRRGHCRVSGFRLFSMLLLHEKEVCGETF